MRCKKDGEFVSAKLERTLARRLTRFVLNTGYSKTAVIERALRQFLDREEPRLCSDALGDNPSQK